MHELFGMGLIGGAIVVVAFVLLRFARLFE